MRTGSYINGQWIHPQSERLVRNTNPADPDEVIAEFPAATAADVQRAIEAAEAAFRDWKNTPGPERGRVIWRAANIARQRADEIARIMTLEEGKILKEAKGEALKGISLMLGKVFACTAKPCPPRRAIPSPTLFAGRWGSLG
jgi:aldehyde dehydrogenase (NAD+)